MKDKSIVDAAVKKVHGIRICQAEDRPEFCLIGQINTCCAHCEVSYPCSLHNRSSGSLVKPCSEEDGEGCPYLKKRYRKRTSS